MLRRQRQIIVQVHRLLDGALFCLGLWLAHRLRQEGLLAFLGRPDIEPFDTYLWLWFFIFPLSVLFLQAQGFYARPLLPSRRRTLWQAGWGAALTSVSLVLISFLAREEPARGVIVLFGPISFLLIVLKEELARGWVASGLGQSQLKRRIVVVGAPEDTEPLCDELRRGSGASIEILAVLNLNETPVERLMDLLHNHSANGVLLVARHTLFGQVEKVIAACELEGVEVWMRADFFKTQVSHTYVDDFQGHPVLVFRSTPGASWQALGKQVLDLLGALLLLAVFSPVLIAAAVAIRVTSPGPVLFRQQRAGLNGRPFTMLKFRSMVSDAEQRKHELELLNEMSGPVFKLTHDPRVTPVGRLLRKFSIDEFPQLINVLRGEMSLVGPRPLPLDEVRRFDDLAHRRRLSVRPGITCLWQISGRSNLKDFENWVRLDLEYIDNWSLWLDLKILFRTIPVVLFGTGAR